METRSKKNKKIISIDKKKLNSATGLVNYIRTDCIIDYLDILKKNNYEVDEENLTVKKRKFEIIEKEEKNTNTINTVNKKLKTSFDYIVEDGYKFESNIFKKIKEQMNDNNQTNNYIEILENDMEKRFVQTREIILKKQYDVIFGGILVNEENNTYGYPDIIVSGYWIKRYIKDSPIEIPNDKSIYYIIDVKSSLISLISGGENVSTGLLYDGYKAQIYVYKEALNRITGSKTDLGFILGKKYEYYSGGKKITIDDPFSRLGVINYLNEKKLGRDFEFQISKAINWKTELTLNWKDYSLNPINKDEIYPNMKNSYDKNYRKIKKKIAIKNKEITLLWNCGIKNRELAFKNGIKKLDDERLNPEILGFNNKSKKYNIINKMLKINSNTSDKKILLDNNVMEWKKQIELEFYVDFETYSKEEIYGENLNEDYMENINSQVLYMIGVYYDLKRQDNNKKFRCFIINFGDDNKINQLINKNKKLNCGKDSYVQCNDEKDLITKFVNFINSFNTEKKSINKFYENTRLIHWSSAEPIIFNKKILEHSLTDEKYILNWYDLLKVYKDEENPILIKGCYGFGLKEIVKNLNELNLIELKWPELDDGLLSSFIAKNVYKNKFDDDEKINMIINITEYNYIDCLALNKILDFMRNYD